MRTDLLGHKLASKWSPQQIAGWLERTYADDDEMRVSHEKFIEAVALTH